VGLKIGGNRLVPLVVALAVGLYFALYFGIKKGKEPDLLRKYLENHAVALLGEGTAFGFPPTDVNGDGLAELLAFIPCEKSNTVYRTLTDTFCFSRGVLLQTKPRKTTQLLRFDKDGVRNSMGETLADGKEKYKVYFSGGACTINDKHTVRWDSSANVYRKY
jgi:hypothetical protein